MLVRRFIWLGINSTGEFVRTALSAVWARVAYLDAVLQKLAADKVFVLLLLELIFYGTGYPIDNKYTR